MSLLFSALEYLGCILIFPGFLFCICVGFLLSGIGGRLAARMQKQDLPPVIRPFEDFFKLRGKETELPSGAHRAAFLIAPVMALVSLVTVQLFIPICTWSAFPGVADVLVVFYLLLIPSAADALGCAASSPNAGEALSRKITDLIFCALPLVPVLLAVSKTAGGSSITFSFSEIVKQQATNGSFILRPSLIPAALAFLLIIFCEVGSRFPDTTEYTSIPLALSGLNRSIRLFTMSNLFAVLFLGGIGTGLIIVDAVVLFVLALVITGLGVVLSHVLTAHFRAGRLFGCCRFAAAVLALASLAAVWLSL